MANDELLAHAVSECMATEMRMRAWITQLDKILSDMRLDAHAIKLLSLKLEGHISEYGTRISSDEKQAVTEAFKGGFNL